MTDPLGDLGITEIGDDEKTPLREIVVPAEGDDYIRSYHQILRAIEQGTVYTAATKADLENKDGLGTVDEPLVGIAETQADADELTGESVYVYNSDTGEWVDTLQSVESFVEEIESELDEKIDEEVKDLEEKIDDLDIEDISADDFEDIDNLKELLEEIQEEIVSEAFVPQIQTDLDEKEVGDDVELDVRIRNSGRDSGQQDIELIVRGSVVDTQENVELDVDEYEVINLGWVPNEGDHAGNTIELIVETDDQRDSEWVYIPTPADFRINEIDAPDVIDNGDSATISARIENEGEVDATQNIEIVVNGSSNTEPLSLDGGDADTVEYEWDGTTDTGEHAITVETEDDTDNGQIEVRGAAEFDVTSISAPDEVKPDETVGVSATVENVGESENDVEVELLEDWSSTGVSEEFTLSANEDRDIELNWEAPSNGGSHDLTVQTEHNEIGTTNETSTTVDVLEPANFDVSIDTVTPDPEPGDQVDVDVTVDNTGDVEASQDITLDVNGSEEDSEEITVDDGPTTETLTWNTSSGDSGSYDLTVNSDDNSDSTTVDVLEPANFDVSIESVTDDPEPGDQVDVDVTVNNTGDVETTQDIRLDVDGSREDSAEVRVDGGSTSETLTWSTSSEDRGNYDLVVRSDDSQDDESIEVLEPANFEVTEIEPVTGPIMGEPFEVKATIENTGDAEDTQTIGGESDTDSDTESVRVEPGDTESVDLEFDINIPEIKITSNLSRRSRRGSLVDELTLSSTVENTGSVTFEGEMEMDFQAGFGVTGDSDDKTEDLTLDPGDETEFELVLYSNDGIVDEDTTVYDEDGNTVAHTAPENRVGTYTDTGTVEPVDQSVTISSDDDSEKETFEINYPEFNITGLDVPEPFEKGGTVTGQITIENTGGAAEKVLQYREVKVYESDDADDYAPIQWNVLGYKNVHVGTDSEETFDVEVDTSSTVERLTFRLHDEDDPEKHSLEDDEIIDFEQIEIEDWALEIDEVDVPDAEPEETVDITVTVKNPTDRFYDDFSQGLDDDELVNIMIDGEEKEELEYVPPGETKEVDIEWEAPTSSGEKEITVSLDDDDEHIARPYVGTVEPAGEKVWTSEIGGTIYSSPTVVDGIVYVGNYDDWPEGHCLVKPV